MKKTFVRLKHRLIKSQLARSHPERLIAMGEKRLIASFRRAAARSSAYKILLAEAGVNASDIKSPQDFFARCPLLDKANTFQRFDIGQLLCDDVPVTELASVLTSSGHGGTGFALGLSTRKQLRSAPGLIDFGLEMAFDVHRYRTLLINCLPMGVTFNSDAVCVANVSVREDMACAIIRQAGALFEQIILCGDPLFLKRLCDYSQEIGLDWSRYRMHVIIGEETFPETFRDYLGSVLGVSPDDPASGLIGSSMGIGELGLNLFSETRETVALRRACIRHPELLKQLTGVDLAVSPAPTFLVFNPLRTLVEIVNPDVSGVGDLLVTLMDKQAPIPLMRYATGDRMQRILPEVLASALSEFGLTLLLPSLPIVALHGRAKDIFPDGGHIDLFKAVLYQHPYIAQEMSGAHHLSVASDSLHWRVQTRKDSQFESHLVQTWSAKLHGSLAPQLPGQNLKIEIQSYEVFSQGKTIDYERKFTYWQPCHQIGECG